MRRLLVLGKWGLEVRLSLETRHGAGGERHICGLFRRLHWETPGTGSAEGLVLGAPDAVAQESCYVATYAEVGVFAAPTLRHPGALPLLVREMG